MGKKRREFLNLQKVVAAKIKKRAPLFFGTNVCCSYTQGQMSYPGLSPSLSGRSSLDFLPTFVLPGGYKCMMNVLTMTVVPSWCLTQPVAVSVSYP